jgi:hypothetical protein
MIKATGKYKGHDTLFIGLSFGNLDRFRAQPMDTFITVDGKEMGLPFNVLIFSGESEALMAEMMTGGFSPDTKVHIDPKSKQ